MTLGVLWVLPGNTAADLFRSARLGKTPAPNMECTPRDCVSLSIALLGGGVVGEAVGLAKTRRLHLPLRRCLEMHFPMGTQHVRGRGQAKSCAAVDVHSRDNPQD